MASGNRVEINNLQGNYRLSRWEPKRTRTLHWKRWAELLLADADVNDIDTTPDISAYKRSLQYVSLGAIQRAFTKRQIRARVISGTLDGTAQASWNGNLRNSTCSLGPDCPR